MRMGHAWDRLRQRAHSSQDETEMRASHKPGAPDEVEGKLGSRKKRSEELETITRQSGSDTLLVYVGQQVLAARQRLGLTQEQLAEKAGCAPATVFLLENARRNATIRSLSVLATALGVEVAELFPRSNATKPNARATAISKAMSEELERAQDALRRIEHLVHHVDEATEGQPFLAPPTAGGE
jgi:XRE family transcriptional regulator, regulator of sulfur utilization